MNVATRVAHLEVLTQRWHFPSWFTYSPSAGQLAAGAGEGVFDAAKVQRIGDAIRNGQFKVNPDAIADKLIANAQELLGNVIKR